MSIAARLKKHDRVRHPRYGLGAVVAVYPGRGDCIGVKFDEFFQYNGRRVDFGFFKKKDLQ